MSCTAADERPANLQEAADRALCWSAHALEHSDHSSLEAIWWLSTHLAAVERVLHRDLYRNREYRDAVGRQRRRAQDIQWAMWALDHRVTGDARLARRSVESLVGELRRLVGDYAEGERRLLRAAERLGDDEARQRRRDAYLRAVRHGATRPHPVLHRWRVAARMLGRLEATVDHVRDVLDNRHVPRASKAGIVA